MVDQMGSRPSDNKAIEYNDYTLSVKRNCHFFRAMLTKIQMKINHIWTQISYSSPYEAHLKNQMVAFGKKEKKSSVKSQKVTFQ